VYGYEIQLGITNNNDFLPQFAYNTLKSQTVSFFLHQRNLGKQKYTLLLQLQIFFLDSTALEGLGLLTAEVSRSHSDTPH
jgi:hypothetical protein